MDGERDLEARVAAVERLLGESTPSGRQRGFWRWLGWFLLAMMLTANAWMIRRSFEASARNSLQNHFWTLCHAGATGQQRREAFTELLKAGNREWRSARLQNLKLPRADFDGVHLEFADMEGCDLTDSTLVRANLHRANLQLIKFVRADLSYVDLSESFLRKADLTDAIARNAHLPSASLEQSDLINTDLEGANLTEANLLLAVLTGAKLRTANLSWANLDAADLSETDLRGANLEKASIRDTFFADSNWWRAVGLTSETIEEFKREFAPTEKAPAKLKEDYQKWLSQ